MVSLEELAALPARLQLMEQRLAAQEARLGAFIASVDDDVDTRTALRLIGVKSRTTLIELREAGRITYRKEGTRAVYSRASCIAYKLRHTAPAAMRVAS